MRAIKVTKIDAEPELPFVPEIDDENKKRRVAAYARVSTDSDEQLTSYDNQVEFYTDYIQSRPEWEFVKVYTDEGISGLMMKQREGFREMMKDALSGKIDLIITKSVSRFARNTVDSLTSVRKLKNKGVEVYFEKENIFTLDSKGELLITLMSSLAQEESRSISENVKWGKRKRFADGKVSLPYKNFLGYRKGPDDRPEIVPEEAVVIRRIYKQYLMGDSPYVIANELTRDKIPSPSGKKKWSDSTVRSILQNEKYMGAALLQKTYCVDFLTKKIVKNDGSTVPMYYVENSHDAIVSEEVFDMVQAEAERRKQQGLARSSSHFFTGRLHCASCGKNLARKVWHSNSKYRRVIWQCGHKYKNEERCQSKHLYEEEIKEAFVEWVNDLIRNKKTILRSVNSAVEGIMSGDNLEQEISSMKKETEDLAAEMTEMVRASGHNPDVDALIKSGYLEKKKHFEDLMKSIDKKQEELQSKRNGIIQYRNFMYRLESLEETICEFSKELWVSLVDRVVVGKDEILFQAR